MEVSLALKTITIEELKHKSLEEILQSVSTSQQALAIRMPNGMGVVIQPKPQLKPLPVLEGYLPPGWKETIYNDSE